MIFLVGLAADETLGRLLAVAIGRGLQAQFVDLAEVVSGQWRFGFERGHSAEVRYGDRSLFLSPDDSYFCRIVDLSGEPAFASQAPRWIALIDALTRWLELVPARVVNKPQRGLHNGSKPLHEAILQAMGFNVPASIVSCDLGKLLDFVREGPTVSKTVCGERADCISVSDADLAKFRPESGPIHLQRLVAGADARIHVVGEQVIGQRVQVGGVDYRKLKGISNMEMFTVPLALQTQLIRSTADLGLAFAGWDFKIDPAGDYWCLEANPMPGYLPYDFICDGEISDKLINYLEG